MDIETEYCMAACGPMGLRSVCLLVSACWRQLLRPCGECGLTPCPGQAEHRVHVSRDTADVDAVMAEHDAFWKAELNQQRAAATEVNGGAWA